VRGPYTYGGRDFCVRPVPGIAGLGIAAGQWLNGEGWSKHDHAEIYIGGADENAPWGLTVSSYPNRQGIRALTGPPDGVRGAVWSSGAIELTFEQRTGIVKWCRENFRVPYSEMDYVALVAHRLGIPVPGLRAYIASTGHEICSQFVDTAYLLGGGIHLFSDGRWPGDVTPGDLAALVTAA